MAPGGGLGGHGDVDALITERRLQLAGKPGIAGLIANGKTFSISVFASLGSVCDSSPLVFRVFPFHHVSHFRRQLRRSKPPPTEVLCMVTIRACSAKFSP